MMENGLRARSTSNILLGFEGNRNNVFGESYSKPKPWYKSRLLSILCVVWFIFTLCLAIMMIVTLVQPHWIGRNLSGAKASFGLYRTCSWSRTGDCEGSLLEFNSIPSKAWGAASILVLLSIIACFIAIFLWAAFYFCFVNSAYSGFRISSILVFLAGLFFFISCIIYPRGFNADEVREVCRNDANSYKLGECKMMWVYWLAIICTLDAFIMSCFGWLLLQKDDKILQTKKKVVDRNATPLVQLNNYTLGRSTSSI